MKKFLKRAGLVLAVLVGLLLIANAYVAWKTDRRLEAQLEAIRASGAPLSLAELAGPAVPAEQNAATYLRRAQDDARALVKEVQDIPGLEARSRVLTPEGRKKVEAAFAAYPRVVPLLEQAAACSTFQPELDYSLPAQAMIEQQLQAVQGLREVIRVLHARTVLQVSQGRPDEAVQTSLTLLRLTRLLDPQAVVAYLVNVVGRAYAVDGANLALQTSAVSRPVRAALEAELARHDGLEGLRQVFQRERAFGRDLFREFPGRNFWLGSRPLWNARESAYLDVITALADLADDPRPYREVQQDIRTLNEGLSGQVGVFARLILPALEKTYEAAVRGRAMVRSLRILNALPEPGAAGKEVPPLDRLGLPAESLKDPFTGEPLHVRRVEKGWQVYSVGMNFKDDDGALEKLQDVGIGPPLPAGVEASPPR